MKKNPEDMTKDELIGEVRAWRRMFGTPPSVRLARRRLDPELHEFRPCDCPAWKEK